MNQVTRLPVRRATNGLPEATFATARAGVTASDRRQGTMITSSETPQFLLSIVRHCDPQAVVHQSGPTDEHDRPSACEADKLLAS